MKTYIDFNTEKRKNTANSFEKYFFKLMINSAYGKTMENLRKGIKVKSVHNTKDYIYIYIKKSKPTFVSKKVFNKNLVDIYGIKPVLTLDKSICVGFSVLDLSNLRMHDFHYNYIQRNYDAQLLFTDRFDLWN